MAMTPESRRTVFRQIAHCSYVDWPTYGSSPLFDPYDRYAGSTSYEMETLFRLFLLKECHGWDHETALEAHQKLRLVFSMHTVPDSDGRSGSVKIRRVLFGQCSICIDHNPIRIYHLLRIPIESAQPMSLARGLHGGQHFLDRHPDDQPRIRVQSRHRQRRPLLELGLVRPGAVGVLIPIRGADASR